MKAKVVSVSEGESVSLPEDIRDTDVEVINGRNLAVVVDPTAPFQEYVRHSERSRGPKAADIEIPDNAVVAAWNGDTVEFLVPQ